MNLNRVGLKSDMFVAYVLRLLISQWNQLHDLADCIFSMAFGTLVIVQKFSVAVAMMAAGAVKIYTSVGAFPLNPSMRLVLRVILAVNVRVKSVKFHSRSCITRNVGFVKNC